MNQPEENTVIDPDLLAILCCPENHETLRLAEAALVQRLNEQIQAGQLRNRKGTPVTEPLEGGLVRQDGTYLYPIRNRIPVLLIEEGIDLRSAPG